ncbi:hypothetical protein BT69DRAFT_1346776 [Atractiella rhizophila]|nr:hypothetical protein BT69DRAFT_1346776 [Atractiella rhizophila]
MSPGHDYYSEIPIPLSIATEDHLAELTKEVNVSLTIVQDLMDLLRNDKGRVMNIWASSGSAGLGPLPSGALSVPEAAFRSMTRTLAFELSPFGIAVSLVLPGASTMSHASRSEMEHLDPTQPTVSVTNDVRSILSVDANPFVRSVFDTQVKVTQTLGKWISAWKVDDGLIFTVVRNAIEIDYPRFCYPIGIDQLFASWAHGLVPNFVLGWIHEKLYHSHKKWSK